jgi:glycosyltransferase involved in cell wall biosynthesis
MKKKRLLILLPSIRRCGPVLGAVALAKHINKEFLDVTVGYLRKFPNQPHPIQEELNHAGIATFFFDMPSWLHLRHMDRVRSYMQDQRIDILHSYGIRPDLVACACRAGHLSIASVRNIIRMEYQIKYGRLISNLFTRFHIRALAKVDGVIAISRHMQEYLIHEGLPAHRITYIPNFVDFPEIKRYQNRAGLSDRFRASGRVHIGFIGNFNPIKRVDWIIRAISNLQQNRPDRQFTLHLVGDGPLRAKLERLTGSLGLGDQVIFHGYTNDVYEIVSRLDIVVLASQIEGIPRAFMEAMSLGKTCIGPDIGGVSELIEDGETGILFQPDSYLCLVRALERIVDAGVLLPPSRIIQRIDDHFNAQRIADLTLDLYYRLSKQKYA